LLTANGEADLATDAGRMFARIKAAVAAQEVERKSARQRAANESRAEQGLPFITCARPFGYEQDGMTIREDEASAIVWAASQVLTGVPLRQVALELDARGLSSWRARSTAGSSGWAPGSVRRMLTNPRYIAKRVHRGVVVGDGVWPAILDTETHDALVRLFADPRRKMGGDAGRKPQYLLSTIARCGACDGVVRFAGYGHDGSKRYGCVHRHALAHLDGADKAVSAAVLGLISQPGFVEAITPRGDRTDDARKLHDRLSKRLAILRAEFNAGEWDEDTDTYNANKAELQAQIAEAKNAMTAQVDMRVFGDLKLGTKAVIGQWETLGIDAKRAIIDRLLVVRLLRASKPGRWEPWNPDQHLEIKRR
jgi:hypothetical protein